jgi:hypothetical protein
LLEPGKKSKRETVDHVIAPMAVVISLFGLEQGHLLN